MWRCVKSRVKNFAKIIILGYSIMPIDCDADCSLTLVPEDVIPLSDENTRVVFASLYTYADDKDESAFQKIHLPPICLTVQDLHKMFYQTKLKRFNPFVLNKLVGALSKLAIIDTVLANYESSSGNDRMNLTSQQKILLRQELSTLNINNRIQKIVNLDNEDFIASFEDQLMWFDEVEAVEEVEAVAYRAEIPAQAASGTPGTSEYVAEILFQAEIQEVIYVAPAPEHHNVRTSVEINIFSESLQTGIILIVQFIAYVEDSPIFGTAPAPLEIIYDNVPLPTTPSDKCGLCVTYDDSE